MFFWSFHDYWISSEISVAIQIISEILSGWLRVLAMFRTEPNTVACALTGKEKGFCVDVA